MADKAFCKFMDGNSRESKSYVYSKLLFQLEWNAAPSLMEAVQCSQSATR